MSGSDSDKVYQPSHYTDGLPCEAIKFTDACYKRIVKRYQDLDKDFTDDTLLRIIEYYPIVLQYLIRCGSKDDSIVDLSKAHNYLHRILYGEWYNEKQKNS